MAVWITAKERGIIGYKLKIAFSKNDLQISYIIFAIPNKKIEGEWAFSSLINKFAAVNFSVPLVPIENRLKHECSGTYNYYC